ncbi:inositol-pentakisphosphate 2-kinase [Gymnopilus junonius]|uniref:Inositol-pentakisphosphate 2-kinase n=1 Tax=Gymnopilus junonius TaxID=109634 RepID=A0A9P5NWJ7_GYMJU|nr:inositol-pentakisphosphate 2-kinase [Gymnopilus junonius]
MLDIRQSNPGDWEYVSEGAATIVFSYRGPPHADFSGTVLRLRKSPLLGSKPEGSIGVKNIGGRPEFDDPIIEYQAKFMQKLIPPEYLPTLRSVQLGNVWLENLVALQNSVRPQDRIKASEIDLMRSRGVLATDLVGGNYLAIEIKPKWAFLPSPVHLSQETKPIKTQTCRFCMHSFVKVQKGQKVATDYCPLDLFSGDESRMTKAISSLWNAWAASNGSINNLKIFARGKVVKPSEAWRTLKDEVTAEDLDSIRRAFTVSLVRRLLATPILSILSQLQRDLDSLDIEGLSKLWRTAETSLYRKAFVASSENAISDSNSISSEAIDIGSISMGDLSISDWIDFLDTYTSRDKLNLDHANPAPEHLKYYAMAYLLSATFKDCSIFVKLDFLDPLHTHEAEGNFGCVTVVDLEPKNMKKISVWQELDQEIVHTYAVQATRRKVCMDAGQQGPYFRVSVSEPVLE